MPETGPETTSSEGLVRAIGRWSMAALTVNCIIGSGIFGLPAVLSSLLGRASVVAILLAAMAVGVIMACFAEVASRFSHTGGPYLYAQEAFGRFMGIQVAWLVWFVRLTACAANANLFVTYLGEFWPQATRPAMQLAILTLLIGILAAINFRGVKAGTHVSTFFTVAKLASLIFVTLAGGFYLLIKHPAVTNPGPTLGPTQWARAIVLLIFAYGGFEAALISAGEAKNPRRDLPFGLFAALITCAVIYGLIQWVVVGVLPDPAHSQRPLADVARIVMGNGGAALTAVGALLSIYADLFLRPERQHPGDAENHLRLGRAWRLPFGFRSCASAIPDTLFFDSRVRTAGMVAGSVRQLRRERNPLRGIAPVLLRSDLRRGPRFEKEEAGTAPVPASRRNSVWHFGRADLR